MSYTFRTVKILLVESTRSMFDLTRDVLRSFGVTEIYSAFDCDEGFDMFCKYQPDIVILDWLSEPKNSIALAKLIRRHPRSPNPFVPIIVMTGFSQIKRVVMARDAGITEFLVKPYTAKTLAHRLEQIIEKPRQFIKSDQYFGPDRRRRKDNLNQADRRVNNETTAPKTRKSPAQAAREMRERNEKTSTET